jgi:CheY-like chemotaxis protein
MEEDLLKAQKLESIGLLAGGIAHDFNNLLTGIIGNLSLAMMYARPDDEIADKLMAAEKAALRAKDLTQQLLTFAKGGTPIKRTSSLAGVIKEIAELALAGSNSRCQLSIPENLWPVEVDEGQISRAINSLIVNANQAMPGGGVIRVLVENTIIGAGPSVPLDAGRYIKMTIQDQGVGIPPEHLSKIFDPYFTTKQKGSGLGLATAYSIIKNHDGYIAVESKLGGGATFTVYLPASDKEMATGAAADEKPVFGQGRILVMDDEEIIREVAGHMLTFIGYEVEFASDGRIAIELYQTARGEGRPFDAVILDLTVPGAMGGKEAIERLLEMDPHVKAIVSSGYSNDPIIAEYRRHGFRGFVTKPYKIQELSQTLHSVLAEHD